MESHQTAGPSEVRRLGCVALSCQPGLSLRFIAYVSQYHDIIERPVPTASAHRGDLWWGNKDQLGGLVVDVKDTTPGATP